MLPGHGLPAQTFLPRQSKLVSCSKDGLVKVRGGGGWGFRRAEGLGERDRGGKRVSGSGSTWGLGRNPVGGSAPAAAPLPYVTSTNANGTHTRLPRIGPQPVSAPRSTAAFLRNPCRLLLLCLRSRCGTWTRSTAARRWAATRRRCGRWTCTRRRRCWSRAPQTTRYACSRSGAEGEAGGQVQGFLGGRCKWRRVGADDGERRYGRGASGTACVSRRDATRTLTYIMTL